MMAENAGTHSLPGISSLSSNSRKPIALSLDFSDLPGLVEPAPPSNTLLVTKLTDPRIFTPSTLAHLRQLIASHCPTPLSPTSDSDIYTFSPLPSMSRIIIIFHSVAAATNVRRLLDGETIFDVRMRIYFGENTSIAELEKSASERQLRVPRATKQFFISPPPSPPHGWQSKEEDPPNKEVHADDLAEALRRISRRAEPGAPPSPVSQNGDGTCRSRSSTVLFDPADHGSSPHLPAIAVQDTTVGTEEDGDGETEVDVIEEGGRPVARGGKIMAHTSRPPVELMEGS